MTTEDGGRERTLTMIKRLVYIVIKSLLAALLCTPAFAATVFVSQSGGTVSCGGDGSQSTTAVASLTSGSWTAGNTLKLCGTLTSALTAQGSGSSGSPITIFFETGAGMSNAVFPVTGAINLSGRSWIVVDGGAPCGPEISTKASCNGTIQNTANGTGLANHTDQTSAINIDGASNITIQNMLIANIYVHTSLSDTNVPSQPFPTGIWATGATSNIEIKETTLHDANWMISFVGSSVISNLNLHNLEIYNSDHCFAVGVTTQTDNNIFIHDDYCHDGANWDTTADDYHHDGVHLFTTAGAGEITNAFTYNNQFSGNWGNNSTAAIFEEGPSGGIVNNTIYNNVFLQTAGSTWNNGYINNGNLAGTNTSITNLYNNTAIMPSSDHSYTFQVLFATDSRNNLLITNDTSSGILWSVDGTTTGTLDYNAYASNEGSPFFISGVAKTYANFKALGFDSHSVSSIGIPPYNVNSDGTTQSTYIGRAIGLNLCNGVLVCTGNLLALGSTTTDGGTLSAISRPSASAWDIGAFQFNGGTPPSPVAPPTGLLLQVN